MKGKNMDYQLEIKQIVDYPRCRIYREFFRTLMANRDIRTNGSSGRKHWGNGCTSPECTGAGAESEDTGRERSFQYRSRL